MWPLACPHWALLKSGVLTLVEDNVYMPPRVSAVGVAVTGGLRGMAVTELALRWRTTDPLLK